MSLEAIFEIFLAAYGRAKHPLGRQDICQVRREVVGVFRQEPEGIRACLIHEGAKGSSAC